MPQQVRTIINSPIDCPKCGVPVEAYVHNRGAAISDSATPGATAFLSATASEGADETRVVGVSLNHYTVQAWPQGDAGKLWPCGHLIDADDIHAIAAAFRAAYQSAIPAKVRLWITEDEYDAACRAVDSAPHHPDYDFASDALDAALEALGIKVIGRD